MYDVHAEPSRRDCGLVVLSVAGDRFELNAETADRLSFELAQAVKEAEGFLRTVEDVAQLRLFADCET